MTKSLSGRIRENQDLVYSYPVAYCPNCGCGDMPFNVVYHRYGGSSKPYCLCCHTTPEEIKVKGYVSYLDLEETEWVYEL
jgi:hypothetical protein